ncbi:MAG: substrate-binding domain-containing protein [Pirellulaceae bacterium]|jgi:hypothetical protein|nr:substrate-binding domain-containing protein [Pirellulaceae bacterium]
MSLRIWMSMVCLWLIGCAPATWAGANEQGDALAECDPYRPKQEVSGEIRLVGSTSMQQLAALWSDGFRQIHPQAVIQIDCRGSETALPQLAKDPMVLGLMSRSPSADEQRQVEGDLGGRIAALTVGHDALGVIVHRDNPLPRLTWSTEGGLLGRSGGAGVAKTWGDLGLDGQWSAVPIRVESSASQSGPLGHASRLVWGSDGPGSEIVPYEQIVQWFERFLGRRPSSQELSAWQSDLERGKSLADVQAGILSSSEFFERQQNDRDRFVDEVYRQLNGTAPTPEQHQSLLDRLERQGDVRHRFTQELLPPQ